MALWIKIPTGVRQFVSWVWTSIEGFSLVFNMLIYITFIALSTVIRSFINHSNNLF
jgi:hypothetical protein